jgi:mevalonate kinase
MTDKVFSKVILSGEHSVLRGGYAVVAPNKNHFLEYNFEEADKFSIELSEDIAPYELLFLGLVESALALSKSSIEDLKVKVKVTSIVPLGEGLGGSAALCVFVARLFLEAGLLDENEVFSFAHEIENVFHGQSSGLDVAGCMTDKIILYQRGVKKIQEIESKLEGYSFTIHQTGEKGETRDCIEHVLKLKEKDKDLFNLLDDKMSEASLKIKSGFEKADIDLVIESFNETTDIFKQWGLVPNTVKVLMEDLKSDGALAIRMTGSGFGGCLVALWDKASYPKPYEKLVFLKI